VEVKENEHAAEIYTGPLQLKLSKTRGTLIDSVKAGGKELV